MDLKKEQYRRIRGAILKLLACEHPGSVDIKVLHFSLDNLRMTITQEELRSHLAYLNAKGYAEIHKRKVGRVEIEMVVITPQGLDVLDGFAGEVGVNIDF